MFWKKRLDTIEAILDNAHCRINLAVASTESIERKFDGVLSTLEESHSSLSNEIAEEAGLGVERDKVMDSLSGEIGKINDEIASLRQLIREQQHREMASEKKAESLQRQIEALNSLVLSLLKKEEDLTDGLREMAAAFMASAIQRAQYPGEQG